MPLTESRPRAGTQLSLLEVPAAPGLPVLDTRHRGTSFHALAIRSVLNPPASTGMNFWSLNPYVGCEFGCSYCYARDTHRWTLERNSGEAPSLSAEYAGEGSAPFERRILIKSDIARVLLRTLDPARVGRTAILIGTATDPYQPAERQFGLTRQVLEALLRFRGLTIGITTKSGLVVRDLDLLTRLAERHEVSVNLSLASVDPEVIRTLEPRTPLPHVRLKALGELVRGGVRAGVLLAPILPGITDTWSSLAAVMEGAKQAGAQYVVGIPLRLGASARAQFFPVLERAFPALAPRYRQHYAGRTRARRAYTRALSRRIRLLQEAFGFPHGWAEHTEDSSTGAPVGATA